MSHIRILSFFILTFSFSLSMNGQDQYSYRGFDSPVSVTQYGGYYYLTNSGKNFGLATKDGDGYISRIKSDGSQEEVTLKYITGLHNPRGIYAIQGVLYVCDIDRLVGFDIKSKNKVFELSFAKENVTQLTGITSVDDKVIYVSATDIHTIFEVHLSSKKYSKWTETTAPTGMLINNNQMYVCSMGTDSLPNGQLGVIDMKSKKYTPLTDDKGYLWGLALNGKRLYYSDWMQFAKRGVIKYIDLDTRSTGQMKFTSKIGGPADFIYDARNDLFIIPAVLEDVVFGCLGFKQSLTIGQQLSGTVLEKDSDIPVEYVNIGVVGKSIGAISDQSGKYTLQINPAYYNDTLRFSCIGYHSYSVKVSEFLELNNWNVKLEKRIYDLTDVVILPKKVKRQKTLGINTKSTLFAEICFNYISIPVETERGILIRNKEMVFIKEAHFNLSRFNFDTALFRINFYKPHEVTQFENILHNPVYVKLSANEIVNNKISIDLRHHNIVVDGDFFVSLEMIEVKQNSKLCFCASPFGETYVRSGRQGNWIATIPNGISFSFLGVVK